MPFASVDSVLEDLRNGKMVVLTDDENRENEGDLILPAQFATPEAITFMLSRALGYLCLAMTEGDCDRLDLHPQGPVNTQVRGTAFTVTIDLHPKHGGTTGVSAKERSRCIQMAIDQRFGPADFVRPGHINPLRSRDGGVLVRTGQTEGSVDLCRLAGLYPAAAIIEIMKPDGEMARVPDLEKFCVEHGLKMCSVAQIIDYRLQRESLVRRMEPVAGRQIRTPHGVFNALMFESLVDPLPHLVLACGGVGDLPAVAGAGEVGAAVVGAGRGGGGAFPIAHASMLSDTPTLVRMHRRNMLGDIFDDLDSVEAAASGGGGSGGGESFESTGAVLRASLKMIAREGRGAVVYLRTNFAGAGTAGSVDDAALSGFGDAERRLQTLRGLRGSAPAAEADLPQVALPPAMRDFGIGGQILRNLGLTKLRLITTSNRSLPGLDAYGLEIVERLMPR
jgi:3,4-dihydroxy 2-butanone 4-phosphate synthase/GTP cyclohydrolase II